MQTHVFCFTDRAQGVADILDQYDCVYSGLLDHQFACFDLRNIQNVVDDL